jgi:hypothetical protein
VITRKRPGDRYAVLGRTLMPSSFSRRNSSAAVSGSPRPILAARSNVACAPAATSGSKPCLRASSTAHEWRDAAQVELVSRAARISSAVIGFLSPGSPEAADTYRMNAGIVGCCAHAGSAHTTAEPQTNVVATDSSLADKRPESRGPHESA